MTTVTPSPDLVGGPRGTDALAAKPEAQTRFEQALLLALRLHGDDVRKGTSIPYIAHLLAVTGLVLEQGGSEEQAIAALLHDAAEDHGGSETLEAIWENFGDTVARIVEACSDVLPKKGEKKPDWVPRKRAYLDHLEHADEEVLVVSLADKIHNARAILLDLLHVGDSVFSRFSAPTRAHTLEYYAILADTFQRRLGTPAASELGRIVHQLCMLAGYRPRLAFPGEP